MLLCVGGSFVGLFVLVAFCVCAFCVAVLGGSGVAVVGGGGGGGVAVVVAAAAAYFYLVNPIVFVLCAFWLRFGESAL